jgi:glutathione synthase/RimK-type ligase-like ATP-grasp enzyme
MKVLSTKPKNLTRFRPIILSRHPSHNILRSINKTLPLFSFRSIIRFGSTTETEKYNNKYKKIEVEINTPDAIKNSSNKLLMKQCFTEHNVKTADWWQVRDHGNSFINRIVPNSDSISKDNLPYPIVAKHIFGSRGRGNTLIENQEELETWSKGKTLSNYIFEKFYNYNREYRLHVTKDGYFYACRKMLKSDTPENDRWFRNDSNSIWVTEYTVEKNEKGEIIGYNESVENPEFQKPTNWKDIVSECVKALNSTGLDFGAIDLRIQSAKTPKGKVRENPEFIVIEINSAPSFGEITSKKYTSIITKLLTEKTKK